MASLLNGTRNTRPILRDSYRFVRSDALVSLTDEDVDFLLANGITRLVDLRSEEETARKPCCLADDERFRYIALPVTNGDILPESPDLVSVSYCAMVDDRMREIISTIENCPTNVIYFCSAGKDRTGVVTAILLRRSGASDDEIIDDYLKSADNLADMLNEFAVSQGIDPKIITPQRRYMEEFLENADI